MQAHSRSCTLTTPTITRKHQRNDALDHLKCLQNVQKPAQAPYSWTEQRCLGCVHLAIRRAVLMRQFRSYKRACMQKVFADVPRDPEEADRPAAPTRFYFPRIAVRECFHGINAPSRDFTFHNEVEEIFLHLLSAFPPASADMDALTMESLWKKWRTLFTGPRYTPDPGFMVCVLTASSNSGRSCYRLCILCLMCLK